MFLRTFPSGLYLELREYRHVSNKSCANSAEVNAVKWLGSSEELRCKPLTGLGEYE